MTNTHWIITANHDNYLLCKKTSEKAGLIMKTDYKENCFKKYHIKITAQSPEQVFFQDLLILATTAHTYQEDYKKKLLSILND